MRKTIFTKIVKVLTPESLILRILSLLAALLALAGVGCSHRTAEVSPVPNVTYQGPQHSVGDSVSGEENQPPASPGGVVCPTDGSFLVVGVGPLTAKTQTVLGEDQGHAGGKLEDFQIYQEGSNFFLLLAEGRDLLKQTYHVGLTQDGINRQIPLAKKELPSAIQKIFEFSYQDKILIAAATRDAIHFLDGDLNELGRMPLPADAKSLASDESHLYVALRNSDVYRIPLGAIPGGGCIDRIAKREDFSDRLIQKIQVAQNRLFILSEKVTADMDIASDAGAGVLQPFIDAMIGNPIKEVEAVWDPQFTRVDVVDLNKGAKTAISNGPWEVAGLKTGRIQVNDFFVNQNKLYLIAGHLLSETENASFQTDLNGLIENRCGNPSSHCVAGAKAVLQSSILSLLGLPAPVGEENLVGYQTKPAAVIIFGDLSSFLTPNEVHVVQDSGGFGPDFFKGLKDAKGVVKGDKIYLAGSRAALQLESDFTQTILNYISPPGLRNIGEFVYGNRRMVGIDYIKEGTQEALLRLKGDAADRGLENIIFSAAEPVREYHSVGLPRYLLGRKGDNVFTSIDWRYFGGAGTAIWNRTSGPHYVGDEDLNLLHDRLGWDPVTENFTFVFWRGADTRDPVDDHYSLWIGDPQGHEVLPRMADIPKVETTTRTEPGDFGLTCTTKTERFLRGVRSIGKADGSGAIHFLLFVEKYSFLGLGCVPLHSYASLVLESYESGARREASNSKVELIRIADLANADRYNARFVGLAHRPNAGDSQHVLVLADDGLFLARDSVVTLHGIPLSFMEKSTLVPKRNLKGLVIGQGEGSDLLLARKNQHYVKFYHYLWANLLDPSHFDSGDRVWPPLSFDENRELAYDLPLEPIPGDLDSIISLNDHHCLLKTVLPDGTSRVELLKMDFTQNRFSHVVQTVVPELFDVGFDLADPRNVVLATGDDGLVFLRLPELN